MYLKTIGENKELLIETLEDLRREVEAKEEITKKEKLEHVSYLTKHQLVLKFERIIK
jgi:hypothetical protein